VKRRVKKRIYKEITGEYNREAGEWGEQEKKRNY